MVDIFKDFLKDDEEEKEQKPEPVAQESTDIFKGFMAESSPTPESPTTPEAAPVAEPQPDDGMSSFQKATRAGKEIGQAVAIGTADLAGGLKAMEELRNPKVEAQEMARRRKAGVGYGGMLSIGQQQAFANTVSSIAERTGKTPTVEEQDKLMELVLELDRRERLDQIQGYIDKIGQLPERDRNIFLQAAIGMAQFAPSMVATAATGGAAGFGVTAAQIYGNKYNQYRDEGIDPHAANTGALVASMLSAPVEYSSNLFQLKLLSPVLGKMGFTKAASGKIAQFLASKGKTIPGLITKAAGTLGIEAGTEGFEEVVQNYAEAFGDTVAANPDGTYEEWMDTWDAYINTPEFIANTKQAAKVGAVGGVLLGGAPTAVNAALEISNLKSERAKAANEKAGAPPPDEEHDKYVKSAKEVAPGQDVKVENRGNGIFVFRKSEEQETDAPTLDEAQEPGIVRDILAGTDGVVPGQEGIQFSSRMDVTNEQATEQLKNNEGQKRNYEEIVLNVGLSEKSGRIQALHNTFDEMSGHIEQALDQDDIEGAESLIRDSGIAIQELTQLYGSLPAELQKQAEIKNVDPGATIDDAQFLLSKDIELKTRKLQEFNNTINNIRLARHNAAVQAVINQMDSASAGQLANVTVDQQMKFKAAGDTEASKIYEGLATLQLMKDNMGETEFNRSGLFNKLLKTKLQLKQLAEGKDRQLDSIQQAVLARQREWIDQELINVRQQKYDDEWVAEREKLAQEKVQTLREQTGMNRPTRVVQPKAEVSQAEKRAVEIAAGKRPASIKPALPVKQTEAQKLKERLKAKEQNLQRQKKESAGAAATVAETKINKPAENINEAWQVAQKEESERSKAAKAFFEKKALELRLNTGLKVEPLHTGTNVNLQSKQELLDKITNTSKSRYGFVYDKLKSLKQPVNVRFVDDEKSLDKSWAPAAVALKDSAAVYVGGHQSGNAILINSKKIKNDLLTNERTMAHEAIHAVVRDKLGKPGTKEREAFHGKLQEFWDGISKEHKAAGKFVSARTKQLIELLDSKGQPIDEIPTYAFTEPGFASWLDSIVVPGTKGQSQTMWGKLKDLIREFAGIAKTKLDELNEIMDTILPDTRASKSGVVSGASAAKAQVLEWVKPLIEAAPGAQDTIIVDTLEEIPGIEPWEVNWWKGANGLWRDGKVYLIAENLHSETEAFKVWMHEQVGHESLRKLFASTGKFDEFLDKVFNDVIKDDYHHQNAIMDIARAYKLDLNKREDRLEATEEWLALKAESLPASYKKSLLSMLRDLFNKIFGRDYKLTEKDVDNIMAAARDRVFGATVGTKPSPVGSRGSALGSQLMWDYFKILKKAGKNDPVQWLEKNGWNGKTVPAAGLTWFKTMTKWSEKQLLEHKLIVKAREDIASGKIKEGTLAYDKILSQFGPKLQGHSIKHVVPFLCTNRKLYGPADENVTTRTVEKNHILLGPFKVKEKINKDGQLVLDTPIFPTDPEAKAKAIDKIVQKNKQWVGWYENWNKFIKDWPGIDSLTKDKYIKIMAVLSAGQGPQGNQELFTRVVNHLESEGPVIGGPIKEGGLGVSGPQADSINEIWEERDYYPTLKERQARYGNKVGAYMTAGLAPSHEGGIVIDRHMPRAWGYDITWSPDGNHNRFQVAPAVEEEIVADISEAAKRNGITPAGVQAAIWYETRVPDTQASEYKEAAQVNPSRFLPHVMHKDILAEEQYAVHYSKDVLDIINTNKLEDNNTNSYSQGDVQNRKWAHTEGNPYVPMGYFYSTLTPPETIVKTGKKAMGTKMAGSIYDARTDLLGYWQKAADLVKAQGGDIVNAFGNLLKKAGFEGALVKAPGGPVGDWFVMFGDTPVTAPPQTATVRLSDTVQAVEKLPQDVTKQAELTKERYTKTVQWIKESLKDYPEILARDSAPTVAQFSDATSASIEPGVNLTLEGPVPAIKAWAAKAIGLGRRQNGVFIEHPEGEPNGTRIRFAVKKGMTIDDLHQALQEWGIENYNINAGNTIEIDNFVFDGEHFQDDIDMWENFAAEYAQPGWPKNAKYRSNMELVGSWDGEEISNQNYKAALEEYHGKTKGDSQYGKGFIDGQNYVQSIKAGFTVSATGSVQTDVSQGDRAQQSQSEEVDRASRVVRASIADMTFSDEREMDKEWLATNDETMSFVNRLWAMKDQSSLNVNRLIDNLEQDFLARFGGKKTQGKFSAGQFTGTAETELLQKAMNLWIDSGKQLDKVKAYRQEIENKGRKSFSDIERAEIIDRMLSMSTEEKNWALNNIKRYYDEIWDWANTHDLIQGHHDNYVRRVWNMPDEWVVTAGAPGGTGGGFKLVSDRGKTRTLGSIIDGWKLGEEFELKNQAALPNLQQYMYELGTTMANRRFVNYGKSLVSTTGVGIFAENLSDQQARDLGYKELSYKGFARYQPAGTKVRLFARRDIAKILDKVTGANYSSLWNVPLIKWIRRLNAGIKGTVLSVSFFHHAAGSRSWAFGVAKGLKWNPTKAYKRGLERVFEKSTYGSIEGVDYSHIGPVVDLLVRNGLTLGRTQDWEEDIMSTQKGMIESILQGVAPKAALGFRHAQRFRQKFTKSLFNRFFTGLKAEAAALELQHSIEREQRKLGRGLTQKEINTEAEKVGRLINADFGGLHLQRMGRDMNVQGIAQMFLLAPDWTESNFRTVTGMIPGMNAAIGKLIGDFPPPKGMDAMYRRFWFGVICRLAATQSLATMLLMGTTAPRDDDDTLLNFYKKQFSSWEEFKRLRWTGVPVGRLYEALGIDTTDRDPVLSIGGHFFDPLKLMALDELIKGKGSPMTRWVESAFTGTDWRGVPFQGISDWVAAAQKGQIKGGILTKRSRFDDVTNFWNRTPAWMMYNLNGVLPIPGQEMVRVVMGEQDWLSSAAKSVGLHISNATGKSLGEIRFEELRADVNEAERDLKQAQASGDKKAIIRARLKKKELNQAASQVGYAKAALRPIDKRIEKLDALKTKTSDQEAELLQLKRKRNDVFARFLKTVEK